MFFFIEILSKGSTACFIMYIETKLILNYVNLSREIDKGVCSRLAVHILYVHIVNILLYEQIPYCKICNGL